MALVPAFQLISSKVCEVGGELGIGLEATMEKNYLENSQIYTTAELTTHHDCSLCFSGAINYKKFLNVSAKFLNKKTKINVLSSTKKLKDMHYSFDYDEFAFAPCPHYSYLTTIQVYESCGEKAAGAEVAIHGEKLKTDEFGRVSLFMPNGKYPLTVTTATEYAAKIVAIKGAPTMLSIWMKPLSGETTTPAITTTPVETTTETTTEPASSGTDGLQYEFYEDYAEVVGYSGDATEVVIPAEVNGLPVTTIGDYAFGACYSLTSITIPNSVTTIGNSAFLGCYSLTSITIPNSVTTIGEDAFWCCKSLTSITIPNSVISIGDRAFVDCDNLTDVYFTGTEAEWNAITIGSDNDELINATIHYNSTAPDLTTAAAEPTLYGSSPIAESYTADVETGTLQSADFTNLTPGEIYNFYIMQSSEAEAPFSGENLLYISQAAADANGCLTVEFIPKTGFAGAELFVVGMTHPELTADTVSVQLDDITCDGTEQYVEPIVSYNGERLTCGVDYVLEGDFVVTDAGDYTLTISGIGDYVGSVDVAFTVAGTADTILKGDANQDGKIDADDAYTVLVYYAEEMVGKEHTMFDTPELEEQLIEAADIDQDGDLDADDAYLILLYYARVSVGSDVTWEDLTK